MLTRGAGGPRTHRRPFPVGRTTSSPSRCIALFCGRLSGGPSSKLARARRGSTRGSDRKAGHTRSMPNQSARRGPRYPPPPSLRCAPSAAMRGASHTPHPVPMPVRPSGDQTKYSVEGLRLPRRGPREPRGRSGSLVAPAPTDSPGRASRAHFHHHLWSQRSRLSTVRPTSPHGRDAWKKQRLRRLSRRHSRRRRHAAEAQPAEAQAAEVVEAVEEEAVDMDEEYHDEEEERAMEQQLSGNKRPRE